MNQTDPKDLLRLHPSTRGLDESEISQIAQHSQVIRVLEGEVIHEPDEPVKALMLIVSGHLSMAMVIPGGELKTIAHFGRNDQIGLLSMVQEDPVAVKIVAEQDSVYLQISTDAALHLIQELPLWRRNLLRALAPKLRETFLGNKRRTRPRFLALIHTVDLSHHITTLLIEQLTFLGERVAVLSDSETTLRTVPESSASVVREDGELHSQEKIREIMARWSDCERVIVDIRLGALGSRVAEVLGACEAAIWFCTPETTEQVIAQLHPLERLSPGLREKVSVVRLLSPEEQVAPRCPQLRDYCRHEFKLHWDGCSRIESSACTQKAGLDRIIHHLRGISIGLALGGGAARGMAHLGVLQVIDKAGITIDRMSGTSAGALTGILYAAGYTPDFCIEKFANDLKPGLGYRMLPYGDAFYVFFKYRLGGWDRMLRTYLEDWRLEQLAIPFSSVAVDLVAAEPVIRTEGDATHALLESINLPGIARPICREGKALVDGGVLNVVPANVLVNQGSNVVVSSDVSAKISFEYSGNRADTPTEKMHRPGGISSLIRTRTVQDRNLRAEGGGAADIVIEPDVSKVQLTDFKNAGKTARLGHEAAEEMLTEIRRVLHEMDPQLFPL